MDPLSFGLVMSSGVVHAVWNLLAKRVGGEPSFVWLNTTMSAVLYAPVAVLVTFERPLGPLREVLIAVVVSSFIHSIYSVFLQRTYGVGDLSLVYPLARGSGPLLVGLGALLFLGEVLTLSTVLGTLLISGGIALLARVRRSGALMRPVLMAFGVGALIACYTLWDKHAVVGLAISPVVLKWGSDACRALWLAPMALRRQTQLLEVWHSHRREVTYVALLGPFGYILFLLALRTAPVSAVAPLREIGIVVAAFLGGRFLLEADRARRRFAAVLIASGIGVLGLA